VTDAHPIVVFIRAQLDHDERVANDAAQPYVVSPVPLGRRPIEEYDRERLWRERFTPERALLEVAAGRRILARHHATETSESSVDGKTTTATWCGHCNTDEFPCPDLRDLLSIYSDRPGFDPAWVVGR
jgi:hypothetical protein